MHPRITELIAQSKTVIPDGPLQGELFNREGFAINLIKDCADFIDQNPGLTGQMLKDHFNITS